MEIYTIGHSNLKPDEFLELLGKFGIERVIDVRSRPYSRYARWTEKKNIVRYLEKRNIDYHFLGKELGGIPFEKMSDFYNRERNPLFVVGIQKLIDLAGIKKSVILCSEAKPEKCHRYSIIGKHLTNRGWTVIHILRNGETINQQPMLL